MIKLLRLSMIAALAAGLPALAACSSKAPATEGLAPEALKESRWSATYTSNGEATPLTLILMSPAQAGPARLLVLSAFGATLGDCRVEKGRGRCEGLPGTQGLTRPIAEAIGALLQQDAALALNPDQEPGPIGSSGWRAGGDAAGTLEYQFESSDRTLSMKRMDLK